jgi:uncharacterized protein with GYD domain
MPHYLLQGSYSAQGISGLISSPDERSEAIRQGIEGVGGNVESVYYCFGDYDVMAIFEIPDNVTMAALLMAVRSTGSVTDVKTTVLLTQSEGVEAAHKASSIGYRPPGAH